MRRVIVAALAAAFAVTVAGCSSSSQEQAIDDLAETAGVEADQIEVLLHEDVTWRDDTLGCLSTGQDSDEQADQTSDEQADQAGDQQQVEGYWIVLRLDGENVAYHGANDERPFRCDDPDPDGAIHDDPPAAS